MGRNVQLGRGGKVHYSTTPEGWMPGPDCGGNRAVEGYQVVTAEVDCKNCLKIMAAEAAKVEENSVPEASASEESVNVVSVNGGKVHSMMAGMEEHPYPLCRGGGMNQSLTKFVTTNAPLSCKTCLTYAERRGESTETKRVMLELQREVSHMTRAGETFHMGSVEDYASDAKAWLRDRSELGQRDIEKADYSIALEYFREVTGYNEENQEMTDSNDVTTEREVMDQVAANIERAASLAEAENAEGLVELNKETETLVSSLPTRGKAPNGETWAKYKQGARNAFREAAQAKPKPEPKPEPKAEIVVRTYEEFEGVPELVNMGAQKVAEGVRMHIKTSTTAKEIASIILDMWRRIPNKDENPDIIGASDQAKKASSALYKAAGEALAGEDAFETEAAVKKLMRAVQTQRTDVRANYLRSLDEDTADAAEERKHFATLLADKPAELPASEFLAAHYGVGLKGEIEKSRERWAEKRELVAKAEAAAGEGEADEQPMNPDDEIRAVVKRLRADINKAKPETFEAASDDAKEEVRVELETLYKAIKDMITATL